MANAIAAPSRRPKPLSVLEKLPFELMMASFIPNLRMQPDGSCPPLLVALGTDHRNRALYRGACKLYKEVNFIVTSDNVLRFNQKNLRKELFKIKHLRIEYPVDFRSQKMTLQNRLQSLTIDI